jgi:acylphosphatase
MPRLHAYVSGRVQGVFYRASAEAVANQLHLKGWVQNLPDGRVELLAEGPQEALDRLLAWAHRGPDHAQVSGVEATWPPETGEFTHFEQRR